MRGKTLLITIVLSLCLIFEACSNSHDASNANSKLSVTQEVTNITEEQPADDIISDLNNTALETKDEAESDNSGEETIEECTIWDGVTTDYEIRCRHENLAVDNVNGTGIKVDYLVYLYDGQDEKVSAAFDVLNTAIKKDAQAQVYVFTSELNEHDSAEEIFERWSGNPYIFCANNQLLSVSFVASDYTDRPAPINQSCSYNVDITNCKLLEIGDVVDLNNSFFKIVSDSLIEQETGATFPDDLQQQITNNISDAKWNIKDDELFITFPNSSVGATNDIYCVTATIPTDRVDLKIF